MPQQAKNTAFKAFVLALGLAALVFLPYVLLDKGYFLYYGDFNVQQIPFYKLAHEAVRSGDIGWNWYTDLGANFVGSYSFYLLFSPFFWLTLPFPTAWLPFFMAPLLVLKTACAAFTGCLYIQRFLKDKRFAVIGGLLYAFSGYMTFNIFFNHFHDVVVFFPLLLVGLEKKMTEQKIGLFALAVALNAAVNYWFFIGEVVFVVLYVAVRATSPQWRMNLGRFVGIAAEAVLGLGLAAVAVLPSLLALMGNPRTTAESLTNGWSFWFYHHNQRLPAILSSLFFPPDLPARPNLFPDHGAKWASLSAWLPMFSLTGVLAYFFGKPKNWLKRMLLLCLIMASVPGLNNLFILLNNSYYARWFYMPLLLMALATTCALEALPQNPEPFRKGLLWTWGITVLIAVMVGLTPKIVDVANEETASLLARLIGLPENKTIHFGLMANPQLFWAWTLFALAGLVAVLFLIAQRNSHKFRRLTAGFLSLVVVAFNITFIANGKIHSDETATVVETAIRGRENLILPDEPFARTDVYKGMDNLAMFWHLPNIQAFHSIVPASLMEFYPAIGVKRDVSSKPETKFYPLRSLLSVRWLFIKADEEEQAPMPGYTHRSTQLGFNVYENENYLPMGFGYTRYLTRETLDELSEVHRSEVLLRALVLEEDAVQRNADLLTPLTDAEIDRLGEEAFEEDVAALRPFVAESFAKDNKGFTSRTNLPQAMLMFYSVPFEKGWSATVNGQPAIIEKASIGFMAVRVPAGVAEVRFDYKTPGLRQGSIISLVCGGLIFAWMLLARSRKKQQPTQQTPLAERILLGEKVTMSWGEYQKQYGDTAERRGRLQKTLNEAARRHMPQSLPPEQQTFEFDADTHNGQSHANTNISVDEDGNPPKA